MLQSVATVGTGEVGRAERLNPGAGDRAVGADSHGPLHSPAVTTTSKNSLRVEVTAEAEAEADLARATRQILTDPEVNREFPGGDLWMVAYDIDNKSGSEEQENFSAIVADMASGRLMEVRGDRAAPENWWLRHIAGQRPPSDDEFAWAVKVLTEHHGLADSGDTPYRPMPPLGALRGPDGTADRVVAIGLRSSDGKHRIVGVRGLDGEVETELEGAPRPSAAEWGLDMGEEAPPGKGAHQARVRVWAQDDQPRESAAGEGGQSKGGDAEPPLWELVVVRPSASSGINGSGVELREVNYAGKRVLARAHVPILSLALTVTGTGGDPLAYRSWMHEEAGFEAAGDEPVPGFRMCPQPPLIAADGNTAGGTFRGVALYVSGDELVIVSQVQAGWYRYLSEWRLAADGTIRPRLTVAAAANPCDAYRHDHHAYWRLDFDIVSDTENLVQEFNDPPVLGEGEWLSVGHEVRRSRSKAHGRYWRVRNVRSAATYSLHPGPNDGEADVSTTGLGVGDVWVLRFHDDEVDDGQGFTTDPVLARAQLDRFVTGEPVGREDVVVWYAAHLTLDPSANSTGTAMAGPVGPDLVPGHWVREASNDVFGHVDNTDSYRP